MGGVLFVTKGGAFRQLARERFLASVLRLSSDAYITSDVEGLLTGIRELRGPRVSLYFHREKERT